MINKKMIFAILAIAALSFAFTTCEAFKEVAYVTVMNNSGGDYTEYEIHGIRFWNEYGGDRFVFKDYIGVGGEKEYKFHKNDFKENNSYFRGWAEAYTSADLSETQELKIISGGSGTLIEIKPGYSDSGTQIYLGFN